MYGLVDGGVRHSKLANRFEDDEEEEQDDEDDACRVDIAPPNIPGRVGEEGVDVE